MTQRRGTARNPPTPTISGVDFYIAQPTPAPGSQASSCTIAGHTANHPASKCTSTSTNHNGSLIITDAQPMYLPKLNKYMLHIDCCSWYCITTPIVGILCSYSIPQVFENCSFLGCFVLFFIIIFLDKVCMWHISTIFTIPVNFTCS
jgi:hypothetical protein